MSPRRPSSLSWGIPTVGARPRRRRLDPSLDRAIQAAVLEVLAEVGYPGLTMDAVATTAGVSKATIYRRWPSKADLLVSVIDTASDETLVVPDSGSLRDDLVVLLSSLAGVLAGPGGSASRALLGVMNQEPALEAAFRRGPMARWAEAFVTVLERAVARGELAPSGVTSLPAEAGPAIFLLRWMISGMEIDGGLAVAVVDEVMMPLLRRL
ncbi:TetR/AcrR family transcriptional regulator [Geodermatophilus sp. DSM 44513]|uniref:TetR/AcrR family transcriptional regulator n=1 Tax=Geodermatophilus sp. DSM 44513 TaxID=1528104 RepID=UPI001411ECFD|nr:TetR/AcrR family transcriptional regulator [Geodermatophilus sp. DSM 44513]WNV75190.1 TetR/AcrR family transcriptional regulator [Geodermatophilus sp. DSM 44513]